MKMNVISEDRKQFMSKKLKMDSVEIAYMANRIIERIGEFTDGTGKADRFSRIALCSIITDAVDEINEEGK